MEKQIWKNMYMYLCVIFICCMMVFVGSVRGHAIRNTNLGVYVDMDDANDRVEILESIDMQPILKKSVTWNENADGTCDHPYEIDSYEKLLAFASLVNDTNNPNVHARLAADIECTDKKYIPIGTHDNKYTGIFDGREHTITGLSNVDSSDRDCGGLFGYVGIGGKIQDVKLKSENIEGREYVGGLIGWNEGEVINCFSEGNVTGSSKYTYSGGVVGYNSRTNGIVKNCCNTANIVCSGDFTYVGGIVGWNEGEVVDCCNTGKIIGSGYFSDVGGVIGYNDHGIVQNCYNTGTIMGSMYVGGVIGRSNGKVIECYNKGNITGHNNSFTVGGVVGWNGCEVISCYNTGDVTESGSEISVGGVTGWNEGKVINCYNMGAVSGFNKSDISSKFTGIGGVIGYNSSIDYAVQDCYNLGAVSGVERVGGVIGYNYDGAVQSCYNKGVITVLSNNTATGGVVGIAKGGWNKGKVINCYNSGIVVVSAKLIHVSVGGIAGINFDGSTVQNCYNTGNIIIYDGFMINVGGVIGKNFDGSTVQNCYNIGNIDVSGSSMNVNVGGVIGINFADSTVQNCYYDNKRCLVIGAINGVDDVKREVIGLSTAKMIGNDALKNMNFTAELRNSPWLTKADVKDGNKYYWFYPYLIGFDTENEIVTADHAPRVEVDITWCEPVSYIYTGSNLIPTVNNVVVGDTFIPSGKTVEYIKCKSGKNLETKLNDMPTASGKYKIVFKDDNNDVIDTKYFEILEKGIEKDYIVSYQVRVIDAVTNKLTWEFVTDESCINVGQYRATIIFMKYGCKIITKEFSIGPKT